MVSRMITQLFALLSAGEKLWSEDGHAAVSKPQKRSAHNNPQRYIGPMERFIANIPPTLNTSIYSYVDPTRAEQKWTLGIRD